MTPEKFEKVVLMLSSDQPGEVFAAAQAIGRALPDSGLDWHQFARLVAGRLTARPGQSSGSGYSHTREDEREDSAAEGDHPDQFMAAVEIEMVRICIQRYSDKIKANELSFLRQMEERYDQYGARTFITFKQRSWLHSIWARVHK